MFLFFQLEMPFQVKENFRMGYDSVIIWKVGLVSHVGSVASVRYNLNFVLIRLDVSSRWGCR